MAKGKNAAALFEVIGRGRSSESGPSATRTPSWWWKRPAAPASSAPFGPAQPMLRVDHDHQLVHFSLSTTTSLLIAFGVVVLIVLAFVFGEHLGKNHAPMTAVTSDALMKSSANPQVMNVPPGSSSPTAESEPPADDQAAPQQPTADQTQQAPTSADRKVGLYYVIMQSYPPDLRSDAVEAQTALLTHGVPCTIEETPARLHPKGWLSVIGTTGFPSIKNAETRSYIHSIEQANTELHGKFKKLNPVAYKWR